MKIGVIGSGPAAAATCLGLLSQKNQVDITVLDIGRKVGLSTQQFQLHPEKWKKKTYSEIHDKIKSKSTGWIPEKSYFGDFPSKYDNNDVIYKSDNYGGLSKFWGASFLPFHEADFVDWPVKVSEMEHYYHALLSEINICGASDQLDSYFSPQFVNNPPAKVPTVFQQLVKSISSSANSAFISGSPRLALTTTPGVQGCTNCGHCFYGCYNHSIYSSDQTIEKLRLSNAIKYVPGYKALYYASLPSGQIQLTVKKLSDLTEEVLLFDKLFIAAGCIETTRIVHQSLDPLTKTFPIIENPMFHVPIIYTKGWVKDNFEHITSLNNMLIGLLPGNGIEKYIHMQVYPLNQYLWNHAFRKGFGPLGMHLTKLAQNSVGKHVFMMLFYLHGDYTKGSSVTFGQDDETFFDIRNNEHALNQAKLMLNRLNETLKGSGFTIMKRFASSIKSGGSYHYAGTLPMGTGIVSNSCSLNNHVYIADSSTFPSIPAQNHSYTIMANAYRVAVQSLNEMK